mmetsp:Transcript_8151/g.19103  ORF Transcript_8151/g.19103 Transcript_8151/m.19103 type:complete len:293 (+) Transcript_8151:284-1162(+)
MHDSKHRSQASNPSSPPDYSSLVEPQLDVLLVEQLPGVLVQLDVHPVPALHQSPLHAPLLDPLLARRTPSLPVPVQRPLPALPVDHAAEPLGPHRLGGPLVLEEVHRRRSRVVPAEEPLEPPDRLGLLVEQPHHELTPEDLLGRVEVVVGERRLPHRCTAGARPRPVVDLAHEAPDHVVVDVPRRADPVVEAVDGQAGVVVDRRRVRPGVAEEANGAGDRVPHHGEEDALARGRRLPSSAAVEEEAPQPRVRDEDHVGESRNDEAPAPRPLHAPDRVEVDVHEPRPAGPQHA